jgi:hypothetical protein
MSLTHSRDKGDFGARSFSLLALARNPLHCTHNRESIARFSAASQQPSSQQCSLDRNHQTLFVAAASDRSLKLKSRRVQSLENCFQI